MTLLSFFKEMKFDIVHIVTPKAGLLGGILLRIALQQYLLDGIIL
jgi:hypothetical protein